MNLEYVVRRPFLPILVPIVRAAVGPPGRPRIDPEAGRGVALRVEVDDQHALADRGQGGTEVDRGGGLADAAFLVGDRQHSRAAALGPDAGFAEGNDRGAARVSGGVWSSAHPIGCSGSAGKSADLGGFQACNA